MRSYNVINIQDCAEQSAITTNLSRGGLRMLCMAAVLSTVFIVPIGICYAVVSIMARNKTYDEIYDLPYNKVGLLLAISPVKDSEYFSNRILAASELYHTGKVKHILASGGDYSTGRKGYNELSAMYKALLRAGVPESAITLDYEGQRTLKSLSNARRVYGLDSVTIISQKYHNARAIALASHYGIKAVGYNAPMLGRFRPDARSICREFLARVKMLLDFSLGL